MKCISGFRAVLAFIIAIVFSTPQVFGIAIRDVQPVSLDQPRMFALLKRPPSSTPLMDTSGEFAFEVFFDTGASGVLLSREFAEALNVAQTLLRAFPIQDRAMLSQLPIPIDPHPAQLLS